jgi:predicted transcriptional regulator
VTKRPALAPRRKLFSDWRVRRSRNSVLGHPTEYGYTFGMKTAVSVPDEVFDRAERLAKRLKVSRSELYSRALQEFVIRHSPEEVTEAWDRTIRELGQPMDEFTRRAARRVLERIEW